MTVTQPIMQSRIIKPAAEIGVCHHITNTATYVHYNLFNYHSATALSGQLEYENYNNI